MNRRQMLLWVAGAAASAALFACSTTSDATPPQPKEADLRPLTVDQVAARLAAKDGKTYLFDANVKEAWQAGHVPTAKWVDDENVTAKDLPTEKTATLIFYCHNET